MLGCFMKNNLIRYNLLPISIILACLTVRTDALADTVDVTNAAEFRAAINSATASDTIRLSNSIDMSGIGDVSIKGKNVIIDGNFYGLSSSRNFSLLLDAKTDLTIKNVGQVDKDYNIISSFNNNFAATGAWGGPITTQNNSGISTYYDYAKVAVENSVFSNNFAPTDGGAIGLQTIDFDIQNSVFINNSSAQEGGAIWAEVNHGNIENSYFKGNFVRAKGANTSIGGAITQYGYYANRPTYIDTISGTFVENYSYNFGGAIANREANATAQINKIIGDFQSNYAIQTGGAILNAAGTINSIDGTFIKNYLLNTSTSSATIKNSILLQNNSFGGAIANTKTGGVEATKDSYIKLISGDFIGNFINTNNGKAYGGAIYNSGIIDEISGTFKDNYVFSEGTDTNLALGGAIYSTRDLTITSGKNGTLFSGNYTLLSDGDRNYTAIYIDNSSAILNLIPKSGKTIQINDNIDGKSGYTVNIESDYGGTLKLYNDINHANIITKDVDIDFADSKYHDYEFLSLNSTNTNYLIDFKLDNVQENIQSDTITTNSSSGIITLSDIHFIADKTDSGVDYYNGTYVKQILFNNADGTLQLELGENLHQSQHNVISTAINDSINYITNADDKYYKHIYTGDLYSSVDLATTQTLNDSIKLQIDSLEWDSNVQKEILGDTFKLWLELETAENKIFNINANQQYKITETLDTVPAGTLSLIGQSNISSVLDVNNNALFDLRKESDITLQTVQITSAKSDRGSVIKATNPNSSITIDNSVFIGNTAAAFGGVIFNLSTVDTNTINGTFTSNMAGSSGGAIHNQGNISSIIGEFTSNHTTNSWATGKVVGGAIANKGGTINSISADFNSNYSDQYGGAIANFVENDVSSAINSISSNFNNNYIVVNNSEAFGGAIYNNGTISTITGNFIENHIDQDNLDTVDAKGGAIYNIGTNGLVVSGQFLNNYISVNSSSSALGGAVYTKKNMSIVADNGQNTLFKDNYVKIGNNINNNAIYVDSPYAKLTLNATNNGVISFYDNIDGVDGYDISITGDNTGVIGLYNDVNNADIKAENVSINLVDGTIKDYTLKSLNTETTSNANIAKWNIDVDLSNGTADTIATATDISSGTVLLNNFNIIGATDQDSLIIQILKNTADNDNLQLKIADGTLKVVEDVRLIDNTVYSSKSYLKQEGGISLATTATTNDSIKFLKDGFYDALRLINQKETVNERQFIFDTAVTHSLLEDLGETQAGVLSINGYSNDSNVSVIDLAGKTGFELANENTTININNATLTDSVSASTNPIIDVQTANNVINLNNAQLNGNIVSSTNSYKLNFYGSNVGINGTVDKANAILDNAATTLTFKANTFANANLSAVAGTINLQDSAIDNYNIGTLTSDTNALYNIDVDAFNKQSDTVIVGENSTGIIQIGSINFLNGIDPQDKDFKVQIIYSDTPNITLSLSDSVTNRLYNFGQETDTIKDPITSVVNYNDKFYESVKDFVIKGNLSVLSDNKSIGFKDEDIQKVQIAVKEQELLDSLHELSNLNAIGKIFNFNTATEVYGAITDIKTVVNDLTINGVADIANNRLSVIGLDNNNGFILNDSSTLNVSNVNLRGVNSVITNNGGILNFNDINIINGKLDGTGSATNNGDLYIGASDIALTIDNKNNLFLNDGTLNSQIVGDGTTIINGNVLTLGENARISGTLALNNGTVSVTDNKYTQYTIDSITGSGAASIDVDWNNAKADSFQSTSGTGTIALTLNDTPTDNIWDTKTIQITSGGVGISLAEYVGTKTKTEYGTTDLTATADWSDKIGGWEKTDTYSERISAVSSTGTDVLDSIQYEVNRTVEGATIYTDNLDVLTLIVQNSVGSSDKTFSTTSSTAVYNATNNLGTLTDNLTISGVIDGNDISTINVGNYQGITIDGDNSLTLKDVKVNSNGNVINALTADATITLDNAQIVADVKNNGTLKMKNYASVANISGNGDTVIDTGANVHISGLSQNNLFNTGTLAVDNLEISSSAINNGTINNQISANINSLTNNSGATLNGGGKLALSGTSENVGTISQSIIENLGNLTNTGVLSASDKIVNSGSLTTNAAYISAVNGIKNDNNLTLTSGVLATQIDGSGTTSITGVVSNSAAIYQNVNVAAGGSLTIGASVGDLTNNGTITTNTDYLTGSVNNTGTLALWGDLNKTIAGNGTTIVYGEKLTLSDGAAIKGTLTADSATLNIIALTTDNMLNNLSMNSGTLNLINDNVNNLSANSFNLTGEVNLLLDVDLASSSMDRLPTTTTVSTGFINVKGLNLLSDSIEPNTYIPFAYDSFKDSVRTDITQVGKDTENIYQTTAYAPIYKYDVSYNPNDGTFLFARGGGSSSVDFNPAVLASSVSSQVGTYTAINETFSYAFRHADYSFTPLPQIIRKAITNQYAIQDSQIKSLKSSGFWYQPYATFEHMDLSNGPKVNVKSYGGVAGEDSAYLKLKHGWGTVITPYIAYNGSSQHYSGVSTDTNGGILGLTQSFYKNNFFTAITVNAGANFGESNTMYGYENFTTLMASVANKAGYTFEFSDGIFIIQPTYQLSYSFINTFDYTNAADVKIESEPLHIVQIQPAVKFVSNLRDFWQPYASVSTALNLLNDTKVTANDVSLPQMSIEPYIEYGFGIQKIYQDKFTGFAQAMIRDGGRNGVALRLGFKLMLGQSNKSITEPPAPPVVDKVAIYKLMYGSE